MNGNKLWSLLFLSVPILGIWMSFWAPGAGFGMPRDVSTHGHMIDHLFLFCTVLTSVVFVATELLLVAFMWKYDRRTNRAPVKYTHGSHNLEIIWTILPAATLLFIAIYQMEAWAEVKIDKPARHDALVEVVARQFEWRVRYPGQDGKLGTADDIHSVNEMHVPVDSTILVELKSMDVLHDFFLPNLRVKQDAVPGKMIPVWFTATEIDEYDLVCAELCGWGHYKMKGRLIVESRADFDRWLAETYRKQQAIADEPAPGAAAE